MSFDIMIRVCCFFVPEMLIPINIRKRFSYRGTKNFSPNVISPESFYGSYFYLTCGLFRVRMSDRASHKILYTILLNRLEFWAYLETRKRKIIRIGTINLVAFVQLALVTKLFAFIQLALVTKLFAFVQLALVTK